MSDGRNRFKNHVRAAREWLGQAEHSLDNKEDIRGDLNVMLAQAELQRAKETKELMPMQRWLYRLAPVAVAVLFVVGSLLFWHWEQPRSVGAPEQPPVAVTAPAGATDPPVAATVPQTALQAEVIVTPPGLPERQLSSPEMPVVSSMQEQPAAPQAAVPALADKQEVYMPSENLQKLMCSAGKSLRAQ
jgi:hypothetical protein